MTSEALLTELKIVLARPKFEPKFLSTGKTPEGTVEEFVGLVEIVVPATIPPDSVRDAKDIAVLACAVGGKADFIVSGDKDLLILNTYERIPIVNADQFLQRLSSE